MACASASCRPRTRTCWPPPPPWRTFSPFPAVRGGHGPTPAPPPPAVQDRVKSPGSDTILLFPQWCKTFLQKCWRATSLSTSLSRQTRPSSRSATTEYVLGATTVATLVSCALFYAQPHTLSGTQATEYMRSRGFTTMCKSEGTMFIYVHGGRREGKPDVDFTLVRQDGRWARTSRANGLATHTAPSSSPGKGKGRVDQADA